MDFLLNQDSSEEDNDQLQDKLLNELDCQRSERSFIQINEIDDNWNEFIQGGRERNKMLDKIETRISKMKQIVQAQNNDQENQNNILPREQPIQPVIIKDLNEEFQFETPVIVQEPIIKKREKNKINNQEKIDQERELFDMQIEDQRSQELRQAELENIFSIRLFVLPSMYPSLQTFCLQSTQTPSNPPNYSWGQIIIPKIQTLEQHNLAPKNDKTLVWDKLQQVKFTQLKFEQYTHKQSPKENLVHELELVPKFNIIYQEQLKLAKSSNTYETKSEIFQLKIHNMKQSIQLPTFEDKYEPYYLPPDFELPPQQQHYQTDSDFLAYCFETGISRNVRKLEIKMEQFNSYKGLDQFKFLRILHLSSQNIQNLEITCQNILELNLAQNLISDYQSLGRLLNLRILNLEMNSITEISPLKGCKYLENYNLSGNQISKLTNLNNLRFLRQLIVFKNKLTSVDGLENNILLETLDLGANQILLGDQSFQKNICLRKLILYKNRISQIPNLRLPLLQELYLNRNSLETLNGLLYLPSLRLLHLHENKLANCLDLNEQIVYLPSLEQLQIQNNQIQSFGTIYRLIQRTKLIEIDFTENPFLFGLSDQVLQLYQYLLLEGTPTLKKLNQEPIMKQDISFLQGKFNGFFTDLDHEQQFDEYLIVLHKHQSQMQTLNQLQKKLSVSHPFTFTKQYKMLQIMSDITFLQKRQIPFDIKVVNNYETRYLQALNKVQTFCIRYIYKYRKRNRYFKKHLSKITLLQAQWKGHAVRKLPQIQILRQHLLKNKKDKYAIKIQKVWRGYHLRKKLKKVLGGIGFEDPEFEELEDFDQAFYQQEFDQNYDLKIPNGVDLVKIFQMGSQPPPMVNQQLHQPLPQFESKQNQNNHNMTAYSEGKQKQSNQPKQQLQNSKLVMQSSKYSAKSEQLPQIQKNTSIPSKIGVETLMQNWGFKDTKVAETLAYKLEKERQRKLKGKQKLFTADERLAKFRKS